MEAILLPTKDYIHTLDPEPEWCLPPRFWNRASLLEGYTVYPLGVRVDLPHRKCHTSSLMVIAESHGIEKCKLEMATGYAFSNSLWFRHSWVVNRPDMTLLECTPINFENYYGVILTKKEEQEFREMLED